MPEQQGHGFWKSVPGILTGIAAILTAATGLYVAILSASEPPTQAPPDRPAAAEKPAAQAPATGPVPPPAPPAEPKPTSAAAGIYNLPAVIDDPDGFTNVRSGPSSESQIVTVVRRGETFHTFQQSGNWWQVRTADGKVGYMHLSRIRLVGPK